MIEDGLIVGSVLDVGCGTGDVALDLAARGHQVLGIDFAPAAIAKARAKAEARGLGPAAVTFLEWDALQLGLLVARTGRAFDTLLDVGLFHTLQPADRTAYAASLRSAVRLGGSCFVLCWSDRNPFGYGPGRIRQRDLQMTFVDGWELLGIEAAALETRLPPGRVHAWLARLRAA